MTYLNDLNKWEAKEPSPLSRRSFLKAGGCSLAALGLGLFPFSQIAEASLPTRELSLYNTHTGENLKNVPFWENGRYLPDALAELNHLLRDHRANRSAEIDPKLFDLLHVVNQRLKPGQTFHVISGYRCPETNGRLRNGSKGVAKFSLHMKGKAIDVRLPGVQLTRLRKAGLDLKKGGVGYYPKSDFVHLDTGRVRFW